LERASTGFQDTLLDKKRDHLYLNLLVSVLAAMLENMNINQFNTGLSNFKPLRSHVVS
jgi:hypothetical protein